MIKLLFFILFPILSVGGFFLNVQIFNWVTKLFKIDNARFKTALKIYLWQILYTLLSGIIVAIILTVFELQFLSNIFTALAGGYILHKLLTKYYGSNLKKNIGIYITNLFITIILSFLIIIPIRYFFIEPFYTKGAAMDPNFSDREYMFINKISYRFSNPERGDVVVFRYPQNPQEFFLKRIIGLPGEKIKISDGNVIIFNDKNPNGITLNEQYLTLETKTFSLSDEIITLNVDEYFVLGDNRNASKDSRSFGPVAKSFIIGKYWLSPMK